MSQQADWYRRWKREQRFVPKSQSHGIEMAANVLAPLQAYISLVSGRRSGDLAALKEFADNPNGMYCGTCGALISFLKGHANDCALAAQAIEVLQSGEEHQKRMIEQEQDRLRTRIDNLEFRKQVLSEQAAYDKEVSNVPVTESASVGESQPVTESKPQPKPIIEDYIPQPDRDLVPQRHTVRQ